MIARNMSLIEKKALELERWQAHMHQNLLNAEFAFERLFK